MIEDLENNSLVFIIVGEFLTDLKQEFKEENNEIMEVAELKKSRAGRQDNGGIYTRI